MSNGHKLELIRITDNRIELAYWDYWYGHDVVFIIHADNRVTLRDDADNDIEVNLAESLRTLMTTIESERE